MKTRQIWRPCPSPRGRPCKRNRRLPAIALNWLTAPLRLGCTGPPTLPVARIPPPQPPDQAKGRTGLRASPVPIPGRPRSVFVGCAPLRGVPERNGSGRRADCTHGSGPPRPSGSSRAQTSGELHMRTVGPWRYRWARPASSAGGSPRPRNAPRPRRMPAARWTPLQRYSRRCRKASRASEPSAALGWRKSAGGRRGLRELTGRTCAARNRLSRQVRPRRVSLTACHSRGPPASGGSSSAGRRSAG